MSAERAIACAPAPDESAAEERAWAVVQSAYRARPATSPRGRARRRLVLAPLVFAAAVALALSPAGAAVRRVVDRALGVPHAARALFSLPSPGTLLTSGADGTWTVDASGTKRRLGPWRQAAWSPHGLYLAVAGPDELAAVDPRGQVRWALSRPQVSDPAWYPANGYRVAYLSGHTLRVVAGDGTGDRRLASAVAGVAPSWRPDHPYDLAYVTASGRLVIRDADTGRRLWSVGGAWVTRLAWSADGRELLAAGRGQLTVYRGDGTVVTTVRSPARAPIVDAALAPDGRSLALVRGGSGEDVLVEAVTRSAIPRRVLSGQGLETVLWSPDGRWLLVSWPAADQWVFVRASGRPGIDGVSHIAEQFAVSRAHMPQLEGWCCTAQGTAG